MNLFKKKKEEIALKEEVIDINNELQEKQKEEENKLNEKLEKKKEQQRINQERLMDYIKWNDIEHDDKYIYVYKAAYKDGTSFYDANYKYVLGQLHKVDNFDDNIDHLCSNGIHAFPLLDAIKYTLKPTIIKYKNMDLEVITNKTMQCKILKLKIDKNKVIIPNKSNGSYKEIDKQLRASEVTVIKEYNSLDECPIKTQFFINKIEYNDESKLYIYYYTIYQYGLNTIIKYFFTDTRINLSAQEVIDKIKDEYGHIVKIADEQIMLQCTRMIK